MVVFCTWVPKSLLPEGAMKKVFFVLMVLISTNVFSEVIDGEAKHDTFYGYAGGDIKINAFFAKPAFEDEFGVMVNLEYIEYHRDGTRIKQDFAFFYLKDADIERSDKDLFVIYEGSRSQVATKRLTGWKTLDSVSIIPMITRLNGKFHVDLQVEL